MRKTAVLALLVSVVIAVATLSPSPAAAESGSRTLKRGNAPAAIDLVRMRVDNGPRMVRFTLHVRDLGRRGHFSMLWHEARANERGFAVGVARRPGGGLRTTYHWWNRNDHEVSCPGAVIRWEAGRDRLLARVPQRCFPREIPRRWVFSAQSGGMFGGTFKIDYLRPSRHLTLRRG